MNNHNLKQAAGLLRNGQPLPENISNHIIKMIEDHIQPTEGFVFTPCDGGWLIGESGYEVFHGSKKSGYKFIHNLLKNPRKEIHAVLLFHDLELSEGEIELSLQVADNCRSNIQKRIKSTLENIPDPLGRHLRDSIKTGYHCGYYPAELPKWELAQKCHTYD